MSTESLSLVSLVLALVAVGSHFMAMSSKAKTRRSKKEDVRKFQEFLRQSDKKELLDSHLEYKRLFREWKRSR